MREGRKGYLVYIHTHAVVWTHSRCQTVTVTVTGPGTRFIVIVDWVCLKLNYVDVKV